MIFEIINEKIHILLFQISSSSVRIYIEGVFLELALFAAAALDPTYPIVGLIVYFITKQNRPFRWVLALLIAFLLESFSSKYGSYPFGKRLFQQAIYILGYSSLINFIKTGKAKSNEKPSQDLKE